MGILTAGMCYGQCRFGRLTGAPCTINRILCGAPRGFFGGELLFSGRPLRCNKRGGNGIERVLCAAAHCARGVVSQLRAQRLKRAITEGVQRVAPLCVSVLSLAGGRFRLLEGPLALLHCLLGAVAVFAAALVLPFGLIKLLSIVQPRCPALLLAFEKDEALAQGAKAT